MDIAGSSERVVKIFGPPGTGKTTTLMQLIEHYLHKGVRPDRIAYVAFTRKAAEEAISRAKAKFGFKDADMPHFRTIHSMAFRAIGATVDEVMQPKHYIQLSGVMGFKFTGREDAYSHMPMGTLLGDKCARIEALARLRQIPLREQWMEENEYDCPFQAVQQWDAGLRRFKEDLGMMDFTDLLENFDTELDVDVFIVDEAQDLSNLQWHVVKKASRRAKKVYLAGDDDQAIYAWAGADVRRFLGIHGDTRVLPTSWRLPSAFWEIAETTSSYIRVRQPKEWKPAKLGGELRRIRYEDNLDFRTPDRWMLLARNHSALKRYESVLRSQGYPYLIDGRSSVDTQATRAIVAWERARRGHPTAVATARDVGAFLGQELVLPGRGEIDLARCLPDPGLLQLNWMEALRGIPPAEREYYRSCLANGESLTGTPRVTVSTIHRVKGGEAEHVVLIPDLSVKPFDQMTEDHEMRVLYVGLTRAKQTMTIISPSSIRAYKI